MPRAAKAYVLTVGLAGAAVICCAFALHPFDLPTLAVLLVLDAAFEYHQTVLRGGRVTLSVSFPITLAAILLCGPLGAAALGLTSLVTRSQALTKRFFNAGQSALSGFAAGLVYDVLPGHATRGFEQAHFPAALIPIAGSAVVYVAVNIFLVALVLYLTERLPFDVVWWQGFSQATAANLGYGVIGLSIAVLWAGGVGPVAALLMLVPLFIARWAFQQYGEQHKAYDATVASLIQAVETKDYYTRGHSERVAKAAVMLAKELGMREDRLEMLRYAGMLHDVGKLGVPTKLLQKTGPLDEEEFAAIRLHPSRGFAMVNGISFLDEATQGIKHHHERVDGTGYPDGLAGAQIPEFARIIAVADAFDSMTSTRSYRGARSVAAAIAELRHWAGSQFDVTMVEALVTAVEAHGWQTNVDLTDDVVDPKALVFGDHDDPASNVAAFTVPSQPMRAEVS